jgi:hypothetical protein
MRNSLKKFLLLEYYLNSMNNGQIYLCSYIPDSYAAYVAHALANIFKKRIVFPPQNHTFLRYMSESNTERKEQH